MPLALGSKRGYYKSCNRSFRGGGCFLPLDTRCCRLVSSSSVRTFRLMLHVWLISCFQSHTLMSLASDPKLHGICGDSFTLHANIYERLYQFPVCDLRLSE